MKPKSTIVIPVLNEEPNLPGLFNSLRKLKGNPHILFVENGSADSSPKLLEQFCLIHRSARLLIAAKRGFAPPLNLALKYVRTSFVAFLDADAVPSPDWLLAHELRLESSDVSVGETLTHRSSLSTPTGKLAHRLFKGHSKKAAHAIGYALPWGPTCNLAVRFPLFSRVGSFSVAAEGAMDMDWCWRAILTGATITFSPQAIVHHYRRTDMEALEKQFARYGESEAWIRYRFRFLNEDQEPPSPGEASLAAFMRIGGLNNERKRGSHERLRLSLAFAAGVRRGFEKAEAEPPKPVAPPKKIAYWPGEKGAITVYVPGKGTTEFKGPLMKFWFFSLKEKNEKKRTLYLQSLLSMNEEEAAHFLEDWNENLRPA
jgi:glycosyltransferase involved in cell wall biosynthesis